MSVSRVIGKKGATYRQHARSAVSPSEVLGVATGSGEWRIVPQKSLCYPEGQARLRKKAAFFFSKVY